MAIPLHGPFIDEKVTEKAALIQHEINRERADPFAHPFAPCPETVYAPFTLNRPFI